MLSINPSSLRTHKSICILASILFLAMDGNGVAVAPLSVDRLIEDSDFIAVLKINGVNETGHSVVQMGNRQIPASQRSAQCTTLRSIKGSLPANFNLDFLLPYDGIGYRGLTTGTTRVVFLRRTKEGVRFTNPQYPSLPASNAASNVNTTTVDAELSDVAKGERYPIGDRVTAINALRTMQLASVTDTLKEVFASAKPDPVKATAAQGLLLRNDVTPLPEVENILMGRKSLEIPNYMLRNLSAAIETSLKNEQAIPELENLVTSPDADVSRAAATALRNTGSKKSLKGLARALSSPNLETRYLGVIGLGEINADNEWRPLWDDFRNTPDKYVDHWRAWVTENQILPGSPDKT